MYMFVFEISGLTALQNQLPSLGTGTWSFISLWSENWHYCDLYHKSNNIQHAELYRQDWLLEWRDSMLPLRKLLLFFVFFFFFNLHVVGGKKAFRHHMIHTDSNNSWFQQHLTFFQQFSTRLFLQIKRCNRSPNMQWRNKPIPHVHQEAPLHARFPWQMHVVRAQENQHSTRHASFQSGSCLPVTKVWLLFSWWITIEHSSHCKSSKKGGCMQCAAQLRGIIGTEQATAGSFPRLVPSAQGPALSSAAAPGCTCPTSCAGCRAPGTWEPYGYA